MNAYLPAVLEERDRIKRQAASVEERRELVSRDVTLDGKPAVICGIQRPFATVATLPDGASFEYAWATVARIVREKGGAFTS